MLSLKLDKTADAALYEQLRDGILSAIQAGRLATGDRLPSVAALAGQLKVTQTTVRRAFSELAKAGLINSHVGRGTFVTQTASPVADSSADIPSARQSAGPGRKISERPWKAPQKTSAYPVKM